MRPSLTLKHRSSRLARILALVALLCAVGMPVLEAGHLHDVGDNSAECLLCKTPALMPLIAAVPVFALLLFARMVARERRLAELKFRFLPRQTRGPPAYS